MAAAKKCLNCKIDFIPRRSDASYCSAGCRQRARRGKAVIRDKGVTDKPAPGRARRRESRDRSVAAGHSSEALQLLAELDAEAAEKAEDRGDPPLEIGETYWSAAERAVLELVACTVDRKVDLSVQYAVARDDPKLQIKLSGELRLLEANIARLLKQVKTDLAPERSTTSRKASSAAQTRWGRHGSGSA